MYLCGCFDFGFACHRAASATSPTEPYSELGMLGPNKTAEDYPSNIQSGVNYSVFLYIGNRLGQAAYYMVQVKLVNETQFVAGTDVASVFNITEFVADKQTWEVPIVFSLNYTGVIADGAFTEANVTTVTINGETLIHKVSRLLGTLIQEDF